MIVLLTQSGDNVQSLENLSTKCSCKNDEVQGKFCRRSIKWGIIIHVKVLNYRGISIQRESNIS